ncbi:MAG TPA: glycosyltransferase family 4 protein [Phycisphaerae bacterium]|nr:glycosyltransferase family 4 protein [Phycisphaerae bacterium]
MPDSRIAIFASAFHPHVGGVEELCRQLAHELRRQNHHVIILTNRWPRDLPAFETFEGIPVYRVPQRVPDGSRRAKLNYRLTHHALRRRTRAILRNENINLIHMQCVTASGLYAADAAAKLKIPLVVTLQGELTMDANRTFQRSAFARKLLHHLLDRADLITACSQKTLDDAQAFHAGRNTASPSLADRSAVIFNGAAINDFDQPLSFPHPRPYILAIGRIVPQKGFDLLLKAYAAAGDLQHDLIIAGDGPELPALQQLAADLKITDHVLFPGKADRPTAIALFRSASFFVLPSRADEGLPVVCAEALAAAKPIIATRSGGAPEAILHNHSGLIIEKENLQQLTTALQSLAHNPALRTTLAANAKSRAPLFAWPHITHQYLAAYQRATDLFAGKSRNPALPPASAQVSPA